MFKIRIHISNPFKYCDPCVYIDIELPNVPSIGNDLILLPEHLHKLETMANQSVDIATPYREYFIGESIDLSFVQIKKENLKDLSFEEVRLVEDISYTANQEMIKITITNE